MNKLEDNILPTNVIEGEHNYHFETVEGDGTRKTPYHRIHLHGTRYYITAKENYTFEVVVVSIQDQVNCDFEIPIWRIYELKSGYLMNTKSSLDQVFHLFNLWRNASSSILEEQIKTWIHNVYDEKENYWLVKQIPKFDTDNLGWL